MTSVYQNTKEVNLMHQKR